MLTEPKVNYYRRVSLIALVATLAVGSVTQFGWSQPEDIPTPPEAVATESDQPQQDVVLKDPTSYGYWVFAPALATILIAVIVRQVVPALVIGILLAAYMMLPCMDHVTQFGDRAWVAGIRVAVEKYVIGGVGQVEDGRLNPGRLQVIVFTLLIGGMVGVISANGGTRALVNRVAQFASTSRKGQLAAWLAGMVVFFDDYANSMLVGPTMRPMFDKLKISRAKLAYIVDSTAAPVASIAMIGTWIGAELGFIQDGLTAATGQLPDYLATIDRQTVFYQSIPYRFYAILALWMVLVIALSGRDFGPMRKSESRALADDPDAGTTTPEKEIPATSAWLAGLPILVLVGATLVILYCTGFAALGDDEPTIGNIIQNADSYIAILYGAIASLSVAAILSFVTRACSVRDAFDGALDGMSRMFPAVVVLVLAWALSTATTDLKLGDVASEYIRSADFGREWLPLLIFVGAAIVSFATGTSWGTMGILTPVAVQVSATLVGDMPQDQGLQLFYASVGSVLAGAIFGDHCSPISDTTVLSSIACNCRVEEHVWTQMPYALITAVVAMAAGNYLCMHYNQPHWVGLTAGAAALLLIVLVVGRKPDPRSA